MAHDFRGAANKIAAPIQLGVNQAVADSEANQARQVPDPELDHYPVAISINGGRLQTQDTRNLFAALAFSYELQDLEFPRTEEIQLLPARTHTARSSRGFFVALDRNDGGRRRPRRFLLAADGREGVPHVGSASWGGGGGRVNVCFACVC